MDVNNSVNPCQSEVRVEICTETEKATFNEEPPPPYSTNPTVTNQPTIIHQTIIVQAPLKNTPTFYNCPKCQERVLTRVEYLNSRKTHMLAGFICGFTYWCLLCCLAAIPYLVKTFKKAYHYCPRCNTFLGAYSKM